MRHLLQAYDIGILCCGGGNSNLTFASIFLDVIEPVINEMFLFISSPPSTIRGRGVYFLLSILLRDI